MIMDEVVSFEQPGPGRHRFVHLCKYGEKMAGNSLSKLLVLGYSDNPNSARTSTCK